MTVLACVSTGIIALEVWAFVAIVRLIRKSERGE